MIAPTLLGKTDRLWIRNRFPQAVKITALICDYVRVLKPRLLIAADEPVFADELLVNLQGLLHQAEADATLESLCADIRCTNAYAIVLADHDPIAIDASKLSRKAKRHVLTVKSAASADGGAQ